MPVSKKTLVRNSKRNSKTKKKAPQFLFNPKDPKRSFDVYIDKDPSDTIPIKYSTVEDVEETIEKLEELYKNGKYPHKRIWQVGMILKVRLGVFYKYRKTKYPNAKNIPARFKLAERYFKFLSNRTKAKTDSERKAMTFKF
jgi:hypothetical protein